MATTVHVIKMVETGYIDGYYLDATTEDLNTAKQTWIDRYPDKTFTIVDVTVEYNEADSNTEEPHYIEENINLEKIWETENPA